MSEDYMCNNWESARNERTDFRIPIILPDANDRIKLLNFHLRLQHRHIDKKLINARKTQKIIKEIMKDKEGMSGGDIEFMAKDIAIKWKRGGIGFYDILKMAAKSEEKSNSRITITHKKVNKAIEGISILFPDATVISDTNFTRFNAYITKCVICKYTIVWSNHMNAIKLTSGYFGKMKESEGFVELVTEGYAHISCLKKKLFK